MEQVFFYDVSSRQFILYNCLCIIGLIYLLWKYKGNTISNIIILLFFSGVIDDLGGDIGRNVFRIMMLTWSVLLVVRNNFGKFASENKFIFCSFIVYCFYVVFVSLFVHEDNFWLTFSQLSKIVIPLCLLIIMYYQSNRRAYLTVKWYWLFGDILVVQIILSLGKLVILGSFLEGWVGSMTGIRGGGAGTSLPLLGLMWFALKNDMKFKGVKDYLFVAGLLLIGFVTGKRAVWLLFPILFLILYTLYNYNKGLIKLFVTLIVIVPALFYFGLRISPTLNPEGKVWGSFDPEFATEYILEYSAGIDEHHKKSVSGVGRLGAVKWMRDKAVEGGREVWLGKGAEYFIYADIKDYSNKKYYGGITSRGSVTGIVRDFFQYGLTGVILFLTFIISLFMKNKSKYNIILLFIVLFDFIFYNAQTIRIMPMLIMAMFLSFFSGKLAG